MLADRRGCCPPGMMRNGVQHAEVTCVRRLVSGAMPQTQPFVQVAVPYSKPLAPPSHQAGVRVMHAVPVSAVPATKATAPTCFQAASPQRNGAVLQGPMTTSCPRDHVSGGSSPLRRGPHADSPRWQPRSPREHSLTSAQAVADGISSGRQGTSVTRAASLQRPAVNVPCRAVSVDLRLAPALSRRGEERARSPWKTRARSPGLPVACDKQVAEHHLEVVEGQLLTPPVPKSPTKLSLGDLSPSDSGLLSPCISPFGLLHVAFEEQEANHSKKNLQDTQKRASTSPSEPSKRSYCCSTVDEASPFGGSTLSLSFSEDTDCEGALNATPMPLTKSQSPSRLVRGQQEHSRSEQITRAQNNNMHRNSPGAARPAEKAASTILEKQTWGEVRRFEWASAVSDTVSTEESEEDEECLLPCESELIWEKS
mmetsp:Transcript_27686/g.54345  ORF Transcript_27686/g.54345 Transcript_27686/m.54345 type:complete len:425 (+) Transcript_27686:51-1325(+)